MTILDRYITILVIYDVGDKMKDVSKEALERFHGILHRFIFSSMAGNMSIFSGEIKDISEIDMTIIAMVNSYPDVVLREISKSFNIPASTLTSAVDRLEKKGYLNRKISSRDRRSYGLELTDKGKEMYDLHEFQEFKFVNRLLNALDSEEERAAFMDALEKISTKLLGNNLNGLPEKLMSESNNRFYKKLELES